nr:hypothetical protein [Tanacetum cinerariifolium]GEY07427.1 hypothetical protein [Tanacetum cinerariifolium]
MQCKLPYALEQNMLVIVPLDNLEFSDGDDSTFRVDIASRIPVDNKTIKLLTFAPPVGDTSESMLVVAYRLLNPHCTSIKILEVVVNEVIKWDNTMTSGVRLLLKRIRAPPDFCMTPSLVHRLDKLVPAKSYSNHDLELVVSFVKKTIRDAEKLLAIADSLADVVGNKMHKAFSLPGESSHWQYKFPLPVEGVPTAKSLHCYDEETASQR